MATAAPGAAVAEAVPSASVQALIDRVEAQDTVIRALMARIETLEADRQGVPPQVAVMAAGRDVGRPPVTVAPPDPTPPRSPVDPWRPHLRGRIDADAWLADEARSGSQIRRARLTVDGGDRNAVAYVLSLEFAGGATSVLDAYLSLAFRDLGVIRLGRQRAPFSITGQSSENHSQFMERPAGLEPFLPGYAQGVSIQATGGVWSAQAGVYSRARTEAGEASDDDLLIGGRLNWAPVLQTDRFVHLGVALNCNWLPADGTVRLRQRPEMRHAPYALDSGAIAAEGQTRAGLEAAFGRGAWGGSAEYAWTRIDRTGGGDLRFGGYAIEGWWTLTGEARPYQLDGGVFNRITPRRAVGDGGPGAWQLVARISELDLDDPGLNAGRMATEAVGVNWQMTGAARLMANLSHSRTVTGLGRMEDMGVGLRAHVDW